MFLKRTLYDIFEPYYENIWYRWWSTTDGHIGRMFVEEVTVNSAALLSETLLILILNHLNIKHYELLPRWRMRAIYAAPSPEKHQNNAVGHSISVP